MAVPASRPAADPAARTPWPRLAAVGIGLAALVSVIVLAFSWPGVTSEPKDLPVAIAGPAAQLDLVRGGLEQAAPGVLDLREVEDRDAAVDLIERREAYGAVVLGERPEVLTASAASPVVSQLLSGLAAQLQARLSAALAEQAAAAGVEPPAVTVAVTDVVPLAEADPRGAGLVAAAFPLVLGGMIGGIALTTAIAGAWRRVVAVTLYSLVAGIAIAGILQGWFGVLQGSLLLNAGAFALSLLAIGAVIVGFAALVGPAGIAIGPVLFLLIANPISSAAQPLEFLPEPWGAVGQWFPPGAGATLIRDLSYFPDADTTFPWLVLAGWAVAGLALGVIAHFRRGGEREVAVEITEG